MTAPKSLQTSGSVKYQMAFIELVKRVQSNSLEVTNFLREFELPSHFLNACKKLNLIKPLGVGKYYVIYKCDISICIGKIISIEIAKIEKDRRINFKKLNNASE